jgi:diguanylate cyclase (GGDEF)-like protein/PAS domain S-box-containing protein
VESPSLPGSPPAAGRTAPEPSGGGPRDVLDQLYEIVFTTDAAGNWTSLNAAWTRITGFEVQHTLGTNFLDYVHPDEREHTLELFQAVVAGGADHCHHETRYRTSNGGYRWMELRARLIADETGQPVGNVGVLLDITERRRASETVTEDAHLLELMGAGTSPPALPVAVVLYCAAEAGSFQVRRTSPVLERTLGSRVGVGAALPELFELLAEAKANGSRFAGEHGLIEVALRTGGPQHGELSLTPPPTGSRFVFHVTVLPMRPPNDPGFALVFHDVTGLRRAERQQAAVARLGQSALAGGELTALLEDAVTTVSSALSVPYCLVLEQLGQAGGLLPRAAVGWPGGLHSLNVVSADPALTFLGRAVVEVDPVVSGDLLPGDLAHPGSWREGAGTASAAAVAIGGGSSGPYGVLTVLSPTPRPYAGDELNFLSAIAHVLATAIDRRRAEEVTRHQALHDPLTGLANRALLHDRLAQALRAGRRDGQEVALLLMDLDRFKEINDALGHHVGDAVLRVIGTRLRTAIREADTVARLGGDEFAVVLPNVNGLSGAMTAAEKLRGRVARLIELTALPLHVDGSVGIALAPQHGNDPIGLLRRADVAMYQAKHLGLGVAAYSPEDEPNRPERLTFTTALRTAVDDDELLLHYQPKFDLRTGQVTAVEALVRWQHPTEGLLLPGRFVPLAEQTGLIRPLTQRVLAMAVGQAQAWREAGRPLPVAVNLSARMLHDPDLLRFVDNQLSRAQLPAHLLELEVTESAIMASPAAALTVVHELRRIGVQLAVDDFGTGYSSLSYLRRLPVQCLKIDQSFVQEIDGNEADVTIVRAVIDLGHNLGLRVIGEGIETVEACRLLEELGCDEGQGFYLGRPVPAAAVP